MEFKNYIKKFKKNAIGPLNFQIKKGKITAILGASGSGKSVAIKTMIGAITNFSGDVNICGYSKKKRNSHLANKNVSFYTQMDFSLYEMNVVTYLQNMCIVLGVDKKVVNEKIDFWLDFFDLKKDAKKKIKNFSWGMQNRLSLIICAIKDADILVLDEPGANLDSSWRNKMRNLLVDYKNNNKTILITSHNIDEINDLIDDYIILEDGKQVFNGSKEQLNMYSKYKIYFYGSFNYNGFKEFLIKKNISVFKYDEKENSVVFGTKSTKEINWIFLFLLKEETPVLNLVRLPINMESIYKAIDGGKKTKEKQNLEDLNNNEEPSENKLTEKKKMKKKKSKNNINQETQENNSFEIQENNSFETKLKKKKEKKLKS
ncbi:ABC transporter ATP-binding protein [Spiroplasma tabanidicola]|uniref:ABC transporter ATP-binding protein n=2 Tax=Spiroplasma tabanidicola TaxID=324079 RepID=A0A6I6CJG4_9MOLU|nr:ABC transporter ATP-binding protein [Spiroplasma tabanidicola]